MRSGIEERHVSPLMIFCELSALWTLCPLAGLSQDLLAGWFRLCESMCVYVWMARLALGEMDRRMHS